MKKNKNIDPLDREILIRSFAEFSKVSEEDELLVFERKTALGCMVIFLVILAGILYLTDIGLVLMLIFNGLILSVIYLWNYKYNLRRKPLLVINKKGITYKRTSYEWEHIQELLCAEEYDADSGWHTSTYIRFNYHKANPKIDISGLSRSIEEIIHYINAFRIK